MVWARIFKKDEFVYLCVGEDEALGHRQHVAWPRRIFNKDVFVYVGGGGSPQTKATCGMAKLVTELNIIFLGGAG